MAKSADGLAPHKWRGRWRAAITIGYDETGKQRQKYCYAKTKGECTELWNKLKHDFNGGILVTEASMTLNDWLTHWLGVKSKEVSARTIEVYEYSIKHIRPYLGRTKIEKITPINVQKMQLLIAEEKTTRAAFHARKVLHSAMDDAFKLDLVSRNVVSAVKPIKYEKPKQEIWSAHEVIQFLKFAEGSPYYALFYTALTTGMRFGELMALHWSDIEEDKIHIQHNVSLVKGKLQLVPPKTKRSNRIITLAEDTIKIVANQQERHQLDKITSDLVFCSSYGNFLSRSNVYRALNRIILKSEVTKIRFHDMRHTYASMSIANGCDVVQLSKDLGHATASFTLNVYAHFFAKFQDRQALSLKDLLGITEDELNALEEIGEDDNPDDQSDHIDNDEEE